MFFLFFLRELAAHEQVATLVLVSGEHRGTIQTWGVRLLFGRSFRLAGFQGSTRGKPILWRGCLFRDKLILSQTPDGMGNPMCRGLWTTCRKSKTSTQARGPQNPAHVLAMIFLLQNPVKSGWTSIFTKLVSTISGPEKLND